MSDEHSLLINSKGNKCIREMSFNFNKELKKYPIEFSLSLNLGKELNFEIIDNQILVIKSLNIEIRLDISNSIISLIETISNTSLR